MHYKSTIGTKIEKNGWKKKETLRNVKAEFQNAIAELKENNVFRERIIASTQVLYSIIHTGENPYNLDQLDSIVAHLFVNPTYNGQAETLNILFNSGKINIIQNDSIKKALVRWPQLVEDVTEDELYSSNILFNSFQPLIIKYISLYDIYGKLDFKGYELFDHQVPYSFEKNYAGLFKDKAFEGSLNARELPVSISRLQTEELIQYADNIVRMIDNELNK